MIDSQASDDDAVVYTDASVVQDQRFGCGFSARVRGRVDAEKIGVLPDILQYVNGD